MTTECMESMLEAAAKLEAARLPEDARAIRHSRLDRQSAERELRRSLLSLTELQRRLALAKRAVHDAVSLVSNAPSTASAAKPRPQP